MADDTILPCGFCGTQVWAAPKKRLLYALRGLPLMCLGCGMVQLSVGTKVRGATGKPPPELVAYDLSPYREEHPRIGPAT